MAIFRSVRFRPTLGPHLTGELSPQANDTYLEMAIGNAPWPIGVTMVGIHARTGREKISSRYVAHVLNDETQRKYIQVWLLTTGVPDMGLN